MIRAFNRFLSVRHNYGNPIVQQRALNLLRMNFALFVVIAVLLGTLLLQNFLSQTFLGSDVLVNTNNIAGIALFVAVYWLIQRGRLVVAQWLFIGFIALAILPPYVNITRPYMLIPVPVVLVVAGLLLNRRDFLIVVGVVFAATLLRFNTMSADSAPFRYLPAQQASFELLLAGALYAVIALCLQVFSGSDERVVAGAIKDLSRLNVVTRFGSDLDDVPTEAAIFTRLMTIAQNDLGYELVQIYLPNDDGSYSRQLRLSFGGAPRKVSLTQSDVSILNEALRIRQPVLITWRDDSFRAEHLIPPARQSVTLAIIQHDTVIALLDVQTESERPISDSELSVLNNLTRQVSRELNYTSTIRDLQTTTRDQDAVISRYTRQLSEIQGIGRQASASGWGRYFGGRAGDAFGFDLVDEGGKLVSLRSDDLPAPIRDTLLRGEIHIERGASEQVITVPISFRDAVLGAISFTVPPDRPITDRQIELVRTVAQRLSVALENNRLLEQTQAQARRERQASEIGSALLSATNVESVLSLAAESFHEALGAVHTRVYLQPGTLIKSGDAT